MASAGLRVVILTYGFDQQHLPLVEALVADGCAPERILLVHNPAYPGDAWAPERARSVDLHLMPFNAGYAGGMNEGLRRQLAAGAERVLLLTHDMRPACGMVAALEDALDRLPDVGVAGPVLVDASDGGVWSAGVERTGGTLKHRTSLTAPDGLPLIPADCIDGTAMLVRGDLARQLEGFDERFFMYFEESEFCLRATRRGWRVGVVPGARATTRPGRSKRHAAHAYFLTRNGLEYARRADGWQGMAGALVEITRRSWWALPKPGWSGSAGRAERRVGTQRLIGTAVGLVHFVGRRWGPPPEFVRRMSDIAGTRS